MLFDILTIFPEFFDSPLRVSILRRGLEKGAYRVRTWDIRDFAQDKHRTTDDRPFGGGEGMVMKIGPIYHCLEHVRPLGPTPFVVLLSPKGKLFTQGIAKDFSRLHRIILICGRYEGIDERVAEHLVDMELSIGDYVLSGGEVAALAVVDAVVRLLPGVLGCKDSPEKESFVTGLLEHPHYTRPRDFKGWKVPDVLLSGDHQRIARWRRRKAIEITLERRPELLEKAPLTPEDHEWLMALKGTGHE